jgi:hypothetical protein
MSRADPRNTRAAAAGLRDRLGRAAFGDRVGLALFLGSLCFVTLYWRTGLFITDNATLEATLGALAEGRAWIEPATGDYLSSPGTGVRDGLVYGRNYGQLVLSLPALWGLQALAAVADLHVGLAAVWHLLALAFAVQVGRVVGRQREAATAGSALVLASFLANVALASQFASISLPLLALQATAAVAAGFVAVFLYRAVALKRTRRVGVLAGAGAAVAMPVGFWAVVPKRHAFTALACVALLYLFARSREDPGLAVPSLGTVPAYRAGAYAVVGLLTWIHAAEGLFVFLALVAVDVPTAPSNDARTLAVVGAVFVLSLFPTVVTNALVSGDPFRPPRTLYGAGLTVSDQGGTAPVQPGGTDSGGTGGGGTGGGGFLAVLAPLVDTVFAVVPIDWLLFQTTGLVRRGLVGLTQPVDVYRTFVHSSVEGINQKARFLGVNLAMLEAAPVLGAVGAVVLNAAPSRARRLRQRVDATDVLALFLVVAFVLLFISRLPLNTVITVRYLLPLYPLGAYLLARSALVNHLIDGYLPAVLWSYAGGVVIGGQVLFVVLAVGHYAVAEAARLHAALGLAFGGVLAVSCVLAGLDERFELPAAIALGLAGAAGTVFLLLSGVHYFSFAGEYVLPVVGAVSDTLAAAG